VTATGFSIGTRALIALRCAALRWRLVGSAGQVRWSKSPRTQAM